MAESSGWEVCPVDVLMMVFEHLDTASLTRCLFVNKWWRNITDFYAEHHKVWKDIAQQAMTNRGLTFRTKSSPNLSWKDLYVNFHLWNKVHIADLRSKLLLNIKDIKTLYAYKDNLIVLHGSDAKMKFFRLSNNLQEFNPAAEVKQCVELTEPSCSRIASDDSERLMKKLATCGTFKKYAIFDDSCFYILDHRSVLRRYLWDETTKEWLDQVLGRYYGCSSSIADIHVFNGEVLLLLKKGMVMRLDKKGRNFEKAYYIEYPPYSIMYYLRMFRSKLKQSIERVAVLEVPQYNTGNSVMFDKLNAVVAVPKDKPFKVQRNKEGYMVVECPGLTYALQHGDMLCLGFENGNVDFYRPDRFLSFYRPEIRYNIRSVENCPKDVSIVAMDVQESFESHYLYIATRSSLMRLDITYSKSVKNAVSLLVK